MESPIQTGIVTANKLPAGAELMAIMQQLLRTYNLELAYSDAQKPADIRVEFLELDLNTGMTSTGGSGLSQGAKIIKFPFRSVYVAQATDANTKVYLKPFQDDALIDSPAALQAYPLTLKDSVSMDRVASTGTLFWSSQPGKTITLVFSVSSKIQSGSQVQIVSGGVTQSDGSSVNSQALGAAGTSGSLAATGSAAVILPANSNRKVATLQLTGGNARVGDSSIGVGGPGYLWTPGKELQWRNTGALYWMTDSGVPVANGIEES